MQQADPNAKETFGASAYNRLQQELIEVRTQRDRQIGQLMRLNQLSDALLAEITSAQVAETFAEAIVDVLDIGIGALWLFDETLPETSRFALCGTRAPRSVWAAAGQELLQRLPAAAARKAQHLPGAIGDLLPGPSLVDGLACRCIDRDGRCRGLLVAANCSALAGMAEPVWQESLEVLSLLAQKLAAHLDQLTDRQLIATQLHQLQSSEQRLEAVLKGANDGWWDLDLISGACFLSSRWQEMLGDPNPRQDVEGRFWRDRIHEADRQRFDWLFQQAVSGRGEILETELRLRCQGQQYLPVLIRGTVIRQSDGTPQRFSGSMQDLSERKRHEAQVHRLAFYDSLTELPNRRMLQERMQELGRSTAHPHHGFGVMMLDLDHFKTLNDTHGHAAGDQLLCVVAERLQGCVRHHDMVARLGGDEFVVLLEDLDPDAAIAEARSIRLAENIIQAISQPIQLDLGNIHQSVSIGIALPAAKGSSGEKLMQQADLALYESKSTGRNRVRVFQEDMQQRINALSQLETGIREGLSRGEFSVAYQLQVDSNQLAVGTEALIRWSRGDDNIIAPAEFIPVAQDTGLIHKLGDLMMNQVVADLLVWEQSGLLSDDFRVAINFSTPEFLHPDFAKQVISMLNTTGISGRRLRFEITEDSVLSDLAAAAERMQVLMEHEIEFSLDDFGTGYSSFAYLRYLPVGEVKIDQGFVRRFLQHPQDAAIVRAIIELGRSLGLRVVAEGVETHDQLEALQQAGCELFQGFFFDRPQLELEAHLIDRLQDLQSAAP